VSLYARSRGSSVVTFGGSFLRIVTPSDVRALKNRIDAYVRGMDASVASCSNLPNAMRISWDTFSKGWRTYFDEEDSWGHTAAQMDQGEVYEKSVSDWQRSLRPYCTTNVPNISTMAGAREDALAVLKTLAIAGGVVAGSVAAVKLLNIVRDIVPRHPAASMGKEKG
jgi:hypothetical protein